MTHADRVREAERAVVEAAVYYAKVCREWKKLSGPGLRRVASVKVAGAAHKLIDLRAATCATCGGTGVVNGHPGWCDRAHTILASARPCPSGCDNGRRRDA